MSVKSGPSTLRKVLAGALVVTCLGALLATALRVKAAKLAARDRGRDAIVRVAEPLGPARLALPVGSDIAAGHVTLRRVKDGVTIVDAKGRVCAEFDALRPGDIRRWQEVQVSIVDDAMVEVDFRPGAPCYGPGTYRDLRAGLRIELPGGRTITIMAYEPAVGRAKLEIISPWGAEHGTDRVEHAGARATIVEGASLRVELLK